MVRVDSAIIWKIWRYRIIYLLAYLITRSRDANSAGYCAMPGISCARQGVARRPAQVPCQRLALLASLQLNVNCCTALEKLVLVTESWFSRLSTDPFRC